MRNLAVENLLSEVTATVFFAELFGNDDLAHVASSFPPRHSNRVIDENDLRLALAIEQAEEERAEAVEEARMSRWDAVQERLSLRKKSKRDRQSKKSRKAKRFRD